MSHATVLVVTENKPSNQDLEEIMAPYQEYGSMNSRNSYVTWIDSTEEMEKNFKEETRKVYKKIDDETLHEPYSYLFYRELTEEEQEKSKNFLGGSGNIDGLSISSKDWGDGKGYRPKAQYIPEGYEEVEVTLEQFYDSFESFLRDWHGYDDDNFKDDGSVGYYDNPNSKWDWYEVGGRWAGFFKAKQTNEAEQGTKSWTLENQEIEGFDIIQKKNIDIDAMLEKAKEETEKYWNILLKHYPDLSLFPQKSWMDCVNEYKNDKFDREAIIKVHENQENYDVEKIKSLKEELQLHFEDPISFFFKGNKDLFHKSMIYNQFGTYAILKEKFWYQRGELGWFGTSSNEVDNWEEQFYEIFESIDDEHWLTIIDFHS